ncbi:MAG: transaldolase family protein [Anaerolineaceae bacterium]|jgi:transaldolase
MGARAQRLFGDSTSAKNPAYRDVIYVEELIGKNTVNTIPPQTLAAFLDHGHVRNSLEEDLAGSRQVIEALEKLGIFMDQVTAQSEEEGVKSFADAFTVLLSAIDDRQISA